MKEENNNLKGISLYIQIKEDICLFYAIGQNNQKLLEQKFSYEKEKKEFFNAFFAYLNKVKLQSLLVEKSSILAKFCGGGTCYIRGIKQKEDIFLLVKEKYLKDRILSFATEKDSTNQFCLRCYPDLKISYYELYKNQYIYEFQCEKGKIIPCEKEFLNILLSYLFMKNNLPLALIEDFCWYSIGRATPLGSYCLKKGNIRIEFDYNLLPDVLENVAYFKEYSGQKLYRVLNGKELG